MADKLIPGEIVELLSDTAQVELRKKSNFIYIITLITFFAAIISSVFIKVQVSVKSSALIRPTVEISSIKSLVNGRLKESFIHENKAVAKGAPLFIIESETLAEREKNIQAMISEAKKFIRDYKILLAGTSKMDRLQTPLLQQSFLSYKQKLFDLNTRFNKASADFDRNKKLHNQKVIADLDFENFKFELDKATNDLETANQTQLSQWQGELREYEKELLELDGQLAQVTKEKENLIIRSPIAGNIQSLSGLYPGSLVFTNQDLVRVSPDTSMLVEAYVNPNDIGLVQKDMPARFQVDAFNYNQWGLATGKVTEISNDIHLVNDKPFFKVRCTLDADHLELKNGYKGYFKKGMTLQARFLVTERTLWQLLYDKVDDWVNPNTYIQP
jgi:HlyD family secretion protein